MKYRGYLGLMSNQSDGMTNVWRMLCTCSDQNTLVEQSGCIVMAWACKAASGTDSLMFIDDVSQDGSSRMKSEIYRIILSAKERHKV